MNNRLLVNFQKGSVSCLGTQLAFFDTAHLGVTNQHIIDTNTKSHTNNAQIFTNKNSHTNTVIITDSKKRKIVLEKSNSF